MPKSQTYLVTGVILRVRLLGEKDRIVTILSEEYGIIRAVARGSRNPKSKLAAATQPFVLAQFSLVHGRNLDIVAQAQIQTMHPQIAADALKVAWASYFCELCDSLPDKMPAPEIYALLRTVLERLVAAKSTFEDEVTGRWFEANYLATQGYAPTIGRCAECGQKIVIDPRDYEKQVTFSVRQGGTICESCASHMAGTLKIPAQALRILYRLTRSTVPPTAEDAVNAWHIDQNMLVHLRDILRLSMEEHPEIRTKSRAFLTEMLMSEGPVIKSSPPKEVRTESPYQRET